MSIFMLVFTAIAVIGVILFWPELKKLWFVAKKEDEVNEAKLSLTGVDLEEDKTLMELEVKKRQQELTELKSQEEK